MNAQDLPAVPRPDPRCPDCRGEGYAVAGHHDHAQATLCTCTPACQRCHGTGRVVVTDEASVRTGRCQCQRIPDRVGRFNLAGIPGRYASATLVSFAQGANRVGDIEKTRAQTGVFRWLGQFDPAAESRGLVLHGDVGRGKTHLLVGLVRTLIFEHGVAARFIEFTRLLSMLKEGYSAGRSDAPLLAELGNVPVLAIDELGKGRLTDWELSIIDEVVSRRYNAMGCTLGTTNFRPGAPTGAEPPNAAAVTTHPQTLGDRVGERVYSRLREMCDFVEVGGLDFREIRL